MEQHPRAPPCTDPSADDLPRVQSPLVLLYTCSACQLCPTQALHASFVFSQSLRLPCERAGGCRRHCEPILVCRYGALHRSARLSGTLDAQLSPRKNTTETSQRPRGQDDQLAKPSSADVRTYAPSLPRVRNLIENPEPSLATRLQEAVHALFLFHSSPHRLSRPISSSPHFLFLVFAVPLCLPVTKLRVKPWYAQTTCDLPDHPSALSCLGLTSSLRTYLQSVQFL